MQASESPEANLASNTFLHLSLIDLPNLLMRRLRHISFFLLAGVFDMQLHRLCSTTSSSKMKISKAPGLLKEALTVLKIKAEVLRTKLLILASLRRKMALVGAVPRRIHALVSSSDGSREKPQVRVDCYDDKALVLLHKATMLASQEPAAAATAARERDGGVTIDLSEVAMFDEDDHGYPDWTHSLFEDDNCYRDDKDDAHDDARGDFGVLDALDEPSVIDIIRSNREGEGLEFNMDEEIDKACDMFIRRFRKKMNRSF